ncbi:MAG: hypothetical protein K8S16_06020 [Bacteroidales bacterium]|nr:hypothetical protein [Bacteroidales bacterium]
MDAKVEFKVQVGLGLVQQYGKDKIEKIIQDYLNLAILKLSKQELLDDLKTIDIKDNQWLLARKKAWTEYGSKYLFKVTA